MPPKRIQQQDAAAAILGAIHQVLQAQPPPPPKAKATSKPPAKKQRASSQHEQDHDMSGKRLTPQGRRCGACHSCDNPSSKLVCLGEGSTAADVREYLRRRDEQRAQAAAGGPTASRPPNVPEHLLFNDTHRANLRWDIEALSGHLHMAVDGMVAVLHGICDQLPAAEPPNDYDEQNAGEGRNAASHTDAIHVPDEEHS